MPGFSGSQGRSQAVEAVVVVEGLAKAYQGRPVVDGLSFQLGRGEILGLLGPNGAGKTTTISMLLGLVSPNAGRIEILGMDLARERARILTRINFSSTYVSMPYSLTVWENLRVFARLYGIPDPTRRIDEVLALLEIGDLRDRLSRTLSSGQQTRLHLAKALLNKPEVLFLDEPTASLDPDIADKVRSLLKQVRQETGAAVLYTSHNMREMEFMCDRLLILDRGKIRAEGTPAAIVTRFQEPDLEAVFLQIARESRQGTEGAA